MRQKETESDYPDVKLLDQFRVMADIHNNREHEYYAMQLENGADADSIVRPVY